MMTWFTCLVVVLYLSENKCITAKLAGELVHWFASGETKAS